MKIYDDPEALTRLQAAIAEGLKKFEFDLRRRTGAESEQLLLSGSDEVPASYQRMVEEYYRRLSKETKR